MEHVLAVELTCVHHALASRDTHVTDGKERKVQRDQQNAIAPKEKEPFSCCPHISAYTGTPPFHTWHSSLHTLVMLCATLYSIRLKEVDWLLGWLKAYWPVNPTRSSRGLSLVFTSHTISQLTKTSHSQTGLGRTGRTTKTNIHFNS